MGKREPLPEKLAFGVRLLRSGETDIALSVFRDFLRTHPGHAEAMHLAGIAAQAKGAHAEAVSLIERAIAKKPGRASFHLNLALSLAELGRAADAVQQLSTATRLQPDLVEAWYNRGVLHARAGKLDRAAEDYRRVLSLVPNHLAALNNLGELLAKTGETNDAVAAFRRALQLRPDFTEAQYNLARLILDESPVEAAHLLKMVTAALPKLIDARRLLARALAKNGAHSEALRVLHGAFPEASGDAHLHNDIGLVNIEIGRLDDARHAFGRAIAIDPAHVHSLYNLAYLVKGAGNPSLLQQLRTALAGASGMAHEERSMLHFAIGHLLESANDFDLAFQHFATANELKRMKFDPEATGHQFAEIKRVFTREFFAQRSGWGNPSSLPVFVVGMPRSGTTLVEHIFASHPDAAGAGELIAFNQLANGLGRLSKSERPYPGCALALSAELTAQLAEAYLRELRCHGPRALRISDKMPGNFLHLGLIALLLPHAKIIHCQRDPLDTCVSCYTANFTGYLPYAYDLTHLGYYYREYQALMAHWTQVLPLQVYTVQYESLVKEPESEIRRLIGFIGLPWDDRCLGAHQTQRPVATASNVQVREPIYRRSINRAERFKAHLDPLRDALAG